MSTTSNTDHSNNAVYICFDDAFFIWAKSCINSMRSNWPNHPKLLIDYLGSRPEVLDYLDMPDVEALNAIDTPGFTETLPSGPVADRIVFMRFRLWSEEFDRYDRILHLDADTLILDSLDDLFSSEHPFFVSNHERTPYVRIFHPDYATSSALNTLLREDGISYPDAMDDMANAGVFLLPHRFRAPEERRQLEYLANRYGRYLAFADQSLLSLWLLTLGITPKNSYAYNYQPPFFTDPSVSCPFDEIRILHFSSHRKPGTPEFLNWPRVANHAQQLLELVETYR